MKTRCNIIVGMAARAPLTLMDEPTLGLDAAARKEFYSILIRDFVDNPRTIIISSNLAGEMEGILEEIILIKDGYCLLHKPVDELRNYAVCINGRRDEVEAFTVNRRVLNREFMNNSAMIAIENDLNSEDRVYLEKKKLEISGVSVQDVCIYLTGKMEKEGGIHGFEG